MTRALRTWARYLLPLTLLALVALAPLVLLGLVVRPPGHAAQASAATRLAFVVGATAWIFQLWLVAAAAPIARAIDAGAPLSQLRALGAGLRGLAHGALPWLAAVAAILIGGVALVVPGLALLVLFAFVAASDAPELRDALTESAALVRANVRPVLAIVAAMLVVDVGGVAIAKLVLAPPLPKKPDASALAAYGTLVRVAVGIAVVAAPLVATCLAHVRVQRAS